MRKFIAIVLGALALASVAAPVRVGTFNILTASKFAGTENGWDARKESVAALLKKMDLDVVGLQEVRADQREFLTARLPDYEVVGERAKPDNARFCFVPVAYRRARFACEKAGSFWLSETPDVPGSRSWDSAEPRICTYAVLKERGTGRRVVFANTHLDHRGAKARANGARVIAARLRELGGGAPAVLVGDHNSCETEEAAKAFLSKFDNAMLVSAKAPEGSWRSFNDFLWREPEVPAAEALKMSAAARNTFLGSLDGKRKKRGAARPKADPFYERCGGNRIDFVYVTRGMRVLDYRTVNEPRGKSYPSDHFPIIATVEIPEAAKPAVR